MASRESNFSTYNLVTLFLDDDGIRGLAELINMPAPQFAMHASELGLPRSYVYFLSGAVGGGKTSCLAHFKSLTTFNEWIDPKPELMLKPADGLSDSDRTVVDEWINKQFKRKSFLVRHAENEVCVVDRSLIDPLAFTPSHSRKVRACELADLYGVEGAVEGEVILLVGIPQVMRGRIAERHKGGSEEYISSLQEAFRELWGMVSSVRIVDTGDKAIYQVVKEVSRIIHLEQYLCTPVRSILERVSEGNWR